MTWLNSIGGLGWIVLAATPPLLLLLYFLKIRRQVVEVPSTMLWIQTIEDMHVNSLWHACGPICCCSSNCWRCCWSRCRCCGLVVRGPS